MLLHIYAQQYNNINMKFNTYLAIWLLPILLVTATGSLFGELYEGFDLSGKPNSSFGSKNMFGGQTSKGWMSSWQVGSGDVVFSKEDINFENLPSTGGSAKIIGERKENHIGKGYMIRQLSEGFVGTVFGSFRVKPGFLTKDSVFGLLFSLPNVEEMSPKNALFSIAPKRWGSSFGMIGASGRSYKITDGEPCKKGQSYLVIWKMINVPKAGDSSTVTLSFWVLNESQANYYAGLEFDEKALNLAEPGPEKNQVSQYGRQDVKDTKRGIFKGVVLVPFNYNVTNVLFDEIFISKDRFVSTN